ncbi:nuclear factor, interleukin 3 regulated, member 4 [Osmerus eperlanus]|uniref:nuclear factor, interleukin 3 regulated, member 4 n=1 Tax=Osmerus eperlanus TaxID=29151 RepID=UPI002E0E2E38
MEALSLHGGQEEEEEEEEEEARGGLGRELARLRGPLGTWGVRRKRMFTPEEKKDATYWEKRRKNNEAAKRSREKRRVGDHVLESRLVAMSEANTRLQAELTALKVHLSRLCHAPYAPPLCPAPQPHAPSPAGANTQHPERDVYWGGIRDHYGLSPLVTLPNLPTSHPPMAPLTPLPPMAGPGFFLPPTTLLPIRSYLPLLDLQGAVPTAPRPSRPPWGAVLRSGGQRGGGGEEGEEGEQQVPGAPSSSSSSALPHKLRLKTHKTAPPRREGGRQHSPVIHFYVSD